MSYPYDQDISFKSEKSAVDPYSRITFGNSGYTGNKILFRSSYYNVINIYTVDDYGPIWDPEDVEQAYSQVEIKKSLWDALPERDQQSLTLLLLEYYKPKDGVQPIIAYFHDGQYGDNLIVGMTNDDLLADEQEFHLITYNTYIYRSVEDPRTGERSLEEIVPCVVRTYIAGKENNDPHYIPAMKDSMDIPVEQIPKPEIKWTHKTADFFININRGFRRVYYAIRMTTTETGARDFLDTSVFSITDTGMKNLYEVKISSRKAISMFSTAVIIRPNVGYSIESPLLLGNTTEIGTVYFQLRDADNDNDIMDASYFDDIQFSFSNPILAGCGLDRI